MSTSKNIDRICVIAVIVALLLTLLCMNGEALGLQTASREMGYESRIFDTARVHTIDIQMEDWDSFIETCENEEYAVCDVVIDGETFQSVGIRAKGNTSLSTVSSMNSDRYSFKIEFDQYDSAKSYYGLDKLCLNNLIQDNTYMKDYLTYQLMGSFGVAAPLCSYVNITVNGEDWGLYLAVEGVEEAFLQRNYGSDYGDLYKPDSLSFGGGRGNGRDFNMEDFINDAGEDVDTQNFNMMPPDREQMSGEMLNMSEMSDMSQMPENFDPSKMFGEGESFETPEEFDPSTMFEGSENGGMRFDFGGMFGGMGSSDVKLQYIDDDPDSYANIFDSGKTSVTTADQNRLIQSLKSLSENEDIKSVVDVASVIRYFVVHNFVVNGDSYTGAMIHNYYLYEEDGQMAMIPWDYNLAFGGFQAGDATDTVNDPIDTPLSVTGSGDRPMIDWIFSSEEYTDLYHQYFAEFLESTDFTNLIDETAALIAPYVEQDPTKFCTYEEFQTGVQTLKEFCLLRAESVTGQLDGTIPATSDGQAADSSALVSASHITISDMGSMNRGGHGGELGGGFGGSPGEKFQMPEIGQMDDTTREPPTGKKP